MEIAGDTHQKALRINLDPRWYGTVAEIGAGQEVARWFFRAGGAAGTVAKTISAYDMAVSDAVYGKSERYVSMPRLQAMLDHEFSPQRRAARRGPRRRERRSSPSPTRSSPAAYQGGNECHGWMGVKFQSHPRDEPEPDHPARADARRRGRSAAGSPRDRRRQPAARRVLPAPRARAARSRACSTG